MKLTVSKEAFAYILFNEMIDSKETINEDFNPYSRTISDRKKKIKEWLSNFGSVVRDVENNHNYIVYKIPNIEEILGTSYCICRILKDDTGDPYGQIVVKPAECFQI